MPKSICNNCKLVEGLREVIRTQEKKLYQDAINNKELNEGRTGLIKSHQEEVVCLKAEFYDFIFRLTRRRLF